MTVRHLLQTPYLTMREAYSLHSMIPTSTSADTYLIRSHIAYHCGSDAAERAIIKPSRGHSYKIDGVVVRIVDHYDHREGVVSLGCTHAEQNQPAMLVE